MNKSAENDKDRHFEDLITPYLQGKLDHETSGQVERFAADNNEFAERLNFETQIMHNVKQSADHNMDEMPEFVPSFATLKQRIEAEQNKVPWWHIISWKDFGMEGNFKTTLAFASLVAICVSITMLYNAQQGNPNSDADAAYETLSNGEAAVIREEGRRYLRIIFTQELEESQKQALSKELSFRIETGPDSMNSYIVSLEDLTSPFSMEETNTLKEKQLTQLRSDVRFRFVEPLPDNETVQ